jgi:hypothetical protein
MRIIVPKVDLRDQMPGSNSIKNGEGITIGALLYGTNSGRTVELFGKKYRGSFKSHEECVAFAGRRSSVKSHDRGRLGRVSWRSLSSKYERNAAYWHKCEVGAMSAVSGSDAGIVMLARLAQFGHLGH